MEKKFVNVQIPAELYKKIEDRAKEEGTGTAAEFIIEMLKKNMPVESSDADNMTEDEDEKIKERLKALGYMD